MRKIWEKMKNFRFKGALILTLVFVVLLVFVLVFERNREVKEEEEGLATITVWDVPKNDVNKIAFNYGEDKLILNKQDNGSWKGKMRTKDKTEDFDVDSKKLDPVLDELIKIETNDKIKEPSLKDFGLENSTTFTVLTLKNNKEKKIFLGDKNPDGSQYYAKIEGEDYVFLVPTSLQAKMETKESDLK